MGSTIFEIALVVILLSIPGLLLLVVHAMHVSERGEDRRHRERLTMWGQVVTPDRVGSPVALAETTFPEIPNLPEPPSIPAPAITPTPPQDDEDQKETMIFAGPLSRRPADISSGTGG
jgi:hypothetical protein